jgi:hypothetical protein
MGVGTGTLSASDSAQEVFERAAQFGEDALSAKIRHGMDIADHRGLGSHLNRFRVGLAPGLLFAQGH